ncbi:unnamed protein product [Calicophoron daubneyi]
MFHILMYYIYLGVHFRESGAFWGRVVYDDHCTRKGFLPHDTNLLTKKRAQEVLSRSVQRKLNGLGVLGRSRCAFSGRRDAEEQMAIDSAAALFSEVFYDVDLVASDIVAGLLLLRWQTNQWVGSGHRVPLSLIERDTVPCETDFVVRTQPAASDSGDTLGASSSPSWLGIDRLRRVSQIGISMYGKLFYYCLFCFKPRSLCNLCRHLRCHTAGKCCSCAPHFPSPGDPLQFGCCLCAGHTCNLAAVLELGGIRAEDLISITFDNTVYQSPYLVATDDCIRCIVIAVRGTLSFQDTLVDLLYDGIRLEEIEAIVENQTGKRPLFVGHRGMIGSARRLYHRIISEGSIDAARARYPDYDLVVCGHSLGAGIASFLTMLLRPLYPEVKGYALSAPLGMMNTELAEYAKPFLVSIIYGYDAFAHMNKATITDFKWRLVDALSACTVPKYRILHRGTELCLGHCCARCCISPCCKGCVGPPTVGSDTRLLDELTQERLKYPNPDLPYRRPLSLSPPAERGDMEARSSQDSNAWPSRLIDEPRSLIRWMNPDTARLFCPKSFECPSEETMYSSGSEGIPTTHSDVAAEDQRAPQTYELRDGVFGGLVLHIVDVDPECFGQPINRGRVHVQPPPSSEAISINGPSLPSDPFLSKEFLNEEHGCCRPSVRESTVGVWTTYEQFQTFLIHPRMFTDHAPHQFLRAVNRLYASIKGDPEYASRYLQPNQVLRVMRDYT